ncbi:MAG: type II secretion system protein GspC [Deltaproteobacteria bacterium]|nr:type II secretion system protein GspC [Deltaproteobacteria bacterium]
MLETLFRKRFFFVHLALSALLAVLLARTVTGFVARILVEKLQGAVAQTKPSLSPSRPMSAARDFVAAANANIFEGKREIVLPVDGDEPPTMDGDVGDWWNAPKSSLRLRLVGTMAFSEPQFSLASIVDEGKGGASAEVTSINECVFVDTSEMSAEDQKLVGKPAPCNKVGDVAVVKRIEPEKVYILNTSEGRIEYLALNEPPASGDAPPIVAKLETPAAAGDGKDIGEGIVKTGENTYGVPRSAVDGALNNLSELATQARVVPAFEGGKAVGFKLFSIKPGSLYSKIGLQNGDVINRINGYEMSSPEKGLEVYAKLKDSSNITVDVKRRGKPMTLDYAIQ